jgi:alkylhydroperoxidase family enzyme
MTANNGNEKRGSTVTHNTSRLAPPDPSLLPAAVREIFAEETQRFGAPLNTTLVWAHRPALLAGYLAWRKAMNTASLIPERLKYLVYVRVASLNGCPF